MHERLVENWLDSVNERNYQAPFCQALSAKGHRIIHSSRHSQIEFGKDVITIGPDGRPCVFQLKGNPSGRLTLSQYRSIYPQIVELINQPIENPSVPSMRHRAYLVTNGLIEEEVTTSISQLNRGLKKSRSPALGLEIIQRGDLLHMFQELGTSLWPTGLKNLNILLEMLVDDGTGSIPLEKLHIMLQEMFLLHEEKGKKQSAEAIRRRITSGSILVSVALKNFSLKNNYFSIICAWTLYCVYSIAACERYGVSFNRNAQHAIDIALASIYDALLSLSDEVEKRKVLIEGNTMVDSIFYRTRYTLILSLLSLLWFWCEEFGWPSPDKKKKIESFLSSGGKNLYCWGEGAVPQVLSYYWYLKENEGSSHTEHILTAILKGISTEGKDGKIIGMPSPYFNSEDVIRHALAPILGPNQDPLQRETIGRMSFYAESILHLLVRTGRKQACKSLWPNLTKIEWIHFETTSTWQYCLWRNTEGRYVEVMPTLTKTWDDLVDESRYVRCNVAPPPLMENKYLLLLYLIQCPYRGTPSIMRYLSYKYDNTWFIPPPIT